MQLENQSAGNFKSRLWLCYYFFDLFLMDTGLIKYTLLILYCIQNKIFPITSHSKPLTLCLNYISNLTFCFTPIYTCGFSVLRSPATQPMSMPPSQF